MHSFSQRGHRVGRRVHSRRGPIRCMLIIAGHATLPGAGSHRRVDSVAVVFRPLSQCFYSRQATALSRHRGLPLYGSPASPAQTRAAYLARQTWKTRQALAGRARRLQGFRGSQGPNAAAMSTGLPRCRGRADERQIRGRWSFFKRCGSCAGRRQGS